MLPALPTGPDLVLPDQDTLEMLETFRALLFPPSGGPRPAGGMSAPSKGMGMKLGKATKTNQFLESLKAEGEMIVEDVPLPSVSAAAAPILPTDPITIVVEEKLVVGWKRDGGLENMEVQGTMALTVLKESDAFLRIQVPHCLWSFVRCHRAPSGCVLSFATGNGRKGLGAWLICQGVFCLVQC